MRKLTRSAARALPALATSWSSAPRSSLASRSASIIERDEIVFFPLIYWPILADAQAPSPAALAKLNTYIKNGGTIFFDTREDGADSSSLLGESLGRDAGACAASWRNLTFRRSSRFRPTTC